MVSDSPRYYAGGADGVSFFRAIYKFTRTYDASGTRLITLKKGHCHLSYGRWRRKLRDMSDGRETRLRMLP